MVSTVLFTDTAKNKWNAETATYEVATPTGKFKGVTEWNIDEFIRFARRNDNIKFFVTYTNKISSYQLERMSYLNNVELCKELLQVLEEDKELSDAFPSKVNL